MSPLGRVYTLCAAALVLGGCATLGGNGPLIEPGVQDIGRYYRVQAPIHYSQEQDRALRAERWTVNGPLLDAIYFFHGLEDGNALIHPIRDAELPEVRSGMAAHEVAELLADTLRRSGAAQVETGAPEPAAFGNLQGFRFTLRYASPRGLEYQGLAQGAWHGERLLLMYFLAPRLHYYPTYTASAQRLFASVQLR